MWTLSVLLSTHSSQALDISCKFLLRNARVFTNIDTNSLGSMLGVMTMNVGYFLSILAGTFLGSLAVGRFAIMGGH